MAEQQKQEEQSGAGGTSTDSTNNSNPEDTVNSNSQSTDNTNPKPGNPGGAPNDSANNSANTNASSKASDKAETKPDGKEVKPKKEKKSGPAYHGAEELAYFEKVEKRALPFTDPLHLAQLSRSRDSAVELKEAIQAVGHARVALPEAERKVGLAEKELARQLLVFKAAVRTKGKGKEVVKTTKKCPVAEVAGNLLKVPSDQLGVHQVLIPPLHEALTDYQQMEGQRRACARSLEEAISNYKRALRKLQRSTSALLGSIKMASSNSEEPANEEPKAKVTRPKKKAKAG